ncbi:flagellar biosynthetic protein [Buchnera aphidicola (Nipponaphis monzeni)]|uniref:Flagellar protein n=1 Tax=Buchnera aphidicola (Nipponaphis monzeni) TaxID=2495405 RepID=A0A455T9T0_9GAMM|nr:flagellar biosynthetic protein FliO [Buchnera aphidicola]BBI01082.1 flagellar biosynthetic protein [Buchnera aphidicola (Nipponaphis monzeni)]
MKDFFKECLSNYFSIFYDYKSIIKIFISPLIQIILIIIVLSWIYKKLNFLKTKKNEFYIKVIANIPLGPKEKIIVIDLKEVRLILGKTSHYINCLHILPIVHKDLKPVKNKSNL